MHSSLLTIADLNLNLTETLNAISNHVYKLIDKDVPYWSLEHEGAEDFYWLRPLTVKFYNFIADEQLNIFHNSQFKTGAIIGELSLLSRILILYDLYNARFETSMSDRPFKSGIESRQENLEEKTKVSLIIKAKLVRLKQLICAHFCNLIGSPLPDSVLEKILQSFLSKEQPQSLPNPSLFTMCLVHPEFKKTLEDLHRKAAYNFSKLPRP